MIDTATMTKSIANRITSMHQAMLGCVLYMQSHPGIFKRGMAGASIQCMFALETCGAVIMHRHPRGEAHYELAVQYRQAIKLIDAYCQARAAEMVDSYDRRRKRVKAWTARKHETPTPHEKDPRGRVVALSDRRHWSHCNLPQMRTASSLGGNSFAYYG